MITLELIEKIVGLVPIDKNDVMKILQIEDNLTAEIYGNYEKFAIDQLSEDTLLYKIFKFVEGYQQYIDEQERKGKKNKITISHWVIVGKIGYTRYTLRRIKYFFKFFWDRSDLNFFTRIKMSLLKTKRFVGRTVHALDAKTFMLCPDIANRKFKELFKKGEIDRIYIYKTRDELLLNQIYLEVHNNKKLRQYL